MLEAGPQETGGIIRESFLTFGAPDIGEAEIAEVVDTLRSGWIGTGPRTERFERAFAEYAGSPHAVAVSSGTAALHLALLALDIGAGRRGDHHADDLLRHDQRDRRHRGRPVLAEVDPATGNIDPEAVERAITTRTTAILPVHYGGRPCRMDALESLAAEHGLLLIEDAAHAVGASWRGRPAGSIGRVGCFSFYVTKNLTTGEGGMVTLADEALAQRIRRLSLHGLDRDAWQRFSVERYTHYQVVEPGLKGNMTDLQAALGIHQLAKVERGLERRREIWSAYDAGLADLPLTLPAPEEEGTVHARHLYSVLIDTDAVGMSRDAVLDQLIGHRIGTGVHYVPVHLHPWYREHLGHGDGDFPHAERIGRRTLSLPLSAALTDEDVEDVIGAMQSVLSRSAAPGKA